jgi:hypothetical protein
MLYNKIISGVHHKGGILTQRNVHFIDSTNVVLYDTFRSCKFISKATISTNT